MNPKSAHHVTLSSPTFHALHLVAHVDRVSPDWLAEQVGARNITYLRQDMVKVLKRPHALVRPRKSLIHDARPDPILLLPCCDSHVVNARRGTISTPGRRRKTSSSGRRLS